MKASAAQQIDLTKLIRLITGPDVTVMTRQTWPFMSRGITVLGELPFVKLWVGWPLMDARLIALHEAIHILYSEESHNSQRFRKELRAAATLGEIPRWWFWLHVANLWLTARLGRRFLCLVMREEVRKE